MVQPITHDLWTFLALGLAQKRNGILPVAAVTALQGGTDGRKNSLGDLTTP